jgi:hypothetical protein
MGHGHERGDEPAPRPRERRGLKHAIAAGQAVSLAGGPPVRHRVPVADHRAMNQIVLEHLDPAALGAKLTREQGTNYRRHLRARPQHPPRVGSDCPLLR